MQDVPLLLAIAGTREVLTEALPVIQEGPGGVRTRGAVLMAVDALDRTRPIWESHFGAQGPAFSLDRLVYLPTKD
jgi:hypothetical protein